MNRDEAIAPKVTTLPSGLRVVSQNMPGAHTVAAGIWTRAGSRDEAPEEQGLAHFLEHMAFKGTTNRSARQIVEEIEAAGGDLNAATHVETTAYYVRLLGEHLPTAIDVFADILTRSIFDEKEIRREKGVVLQEIGGCEDSPEEWLPDLFMERAFPGQPFGRQILGTRQSVRGFDAEALRRYLRRQYHAPAMVVAAAGNVEHERLVELAETHLSHIPASPPPPLVPARYEGGETRLSRRYEQVHLMLGFRGCSFHDEHHYATHAFAHILGGNMSSRLFQQVREERGLAYTIEAGHEAYSDCGVFSIVAGASEEDSAELLQVSIDAVQQATTDITLAELDRARAQMKVALMSESESPSRRADQLAHQLLGHGRVLSGDEVLDRLDKLSIEDVRAAGRALFESAPTLAAIGPVKNLPHHDRLAAQLGVRNLAAAPVAARS